MPVFLTKCAFLCIYFSIFGIYFLVLSYFVVEISLAFIMLWCIGFQFILSVRVQSPAPWEWGFYANFHSNLEIGHDLVLQRAKCETSCLFLIWEQLWIQSRILLGHEHFFSECQGLSIIISVAKIASDIEICFVQIEQVQRMNIPRIRQIVILKNSKDLINFFWFLLFNSFLW